MAEESSVLDLLERLADIRDQGLLTEEEFAIQKAHILDSSSANVPTSESDDAEDEESVRYDLSEYSSEERASLGEYLEQNDFRHTWDANGITISSDDRPALEEFFMNHLNADVED